MNNINNKLKHFPYKLILFFLFTGIIFSCTTEPTAPNSTKKDLVYKTTINVDIYPPLDEQVENKNAYVSLYSSNREKLFDVLYASFDHTNSPIRISFLDCTTDNYYISVFIDTNNLYYGRYTNPVKPESDLGDFQTSLSINKSEISGLSEFSITADTYVTNKNNLTQLSSLSISSGILYPNFNSSHLSYALVTSEESSITIDFQPTDNAKLYIKDINITTFPYTFSLSPTNNFVTIEIRKFEAVMKYTIAVQKDKIVPYTVEGDKITFAYKPSDYTEVYNESKWFSAPVPDNFAIYAICTVGDVNDWSKLEPDRNAQLQLSNDGVWRLTKPISEYKTGQIFKYLIYTPDQQRCWLEIDDRFDKVRYNIWGHKMFFIDLETDPHKGLLKSFKVDGTPFPGFDSEKFYYSLLSPASESVTIDVEAFNASSTVSCNNNTSSTGSLNETIAITGNTVQLSIDVTDDSVEYSYKIAISKQKVSPYTIIGDEIKFEFNPNDYLIAWASVKHIRIPEYELISKICVIGSFNDWNWQNPPENANMTYDEVSAVWDMLLPLDSVSNDQEFKFVIYTKNSEILWVDMETATRFDHIRFLETSANFFIEK